MVETQNKRCDSYVTSYSRKEKRRMILLQQERTMPAKRSNSSRLVYGGMLVLVVALLTGCASGFTTIAPRLPDKFEKLGRAEGSACGSMLIGPTAYNFIPILLNERAERAYDNAVKSVPGATALANVSMREYWYWWVIGGARCVTIKGEAIR
jgi:hypothetical protein